MSLRVGCVVLAVAVFHGSIGPATAVDLGERYPATLDYSETPRGYEWSCTDADVWRLTQFNFALADKYRLSLGLSQAVFGHHGSNVVCPSGNKGGQAAHGTRR